MVKKDRTVINVYVPIHLKKELVKLASNENRSLSNYILSVLESIVNIQSDNKKYNLHEQTENNDLSKNNTIPSD